MSTSDHIASALGSVSGALLGSMLGLGWLGALILAVIFGVLASMGYAAWRRRNVPTPVAT